MSAPLNAAIVGTGIFATDTHLPTIQKIPEIKPYAAYNRTKAKAETFAEKAGIDKSLVADSLDDIFTNDKVDFIDALLPVQSNLDLIRKAIDHNKPVAIEKPIAANLEQAREIVNITNSTSLPILILENWSYRKSIPILKDVLTKIGDVVSFTYRATGAWNDNNKYLATGWRQNPEHIGGFLSDGGVHQLALLTDVLGPVETVSAFTKQLREESGDDDILFSTFKLQSGAIGTFTYGSAFGATDKSTSFTIYGTNGSVVYDFSPELPKPTITYQTGPSSQQASEKTVIESDDGDTIHAEFTNFVKAVKANDKSVLTVTPASAFHHLAVVAAALESSKSNGTAVTVQKP